MKYPLFSDTVIIVNPDIDKPLVKHLPNNKYNVSEDLSLKIKELFAGKDCNIVYGGTINYMNCIGVFGNSDFRNSDILSIFYEHLLEYSNLSDIVSSIQNDLLGYGKSNVDKNEIRFVPDDYAIDGESIATADLDAIDIILRKYSEVLCFEKHIEEYDSGDILVIEYTPVLKKQRIIPKTKSEIKYTTEQLRQLISDKIKKYYDGEIVVNESKKSDKEFIISFEPVDLDWTPSLEYISDFKAQYGYEPDSSDMYYDYDYLKYHNLQVQIENILGDMFEVSDWEVSTEYRFVECTAKFKS